MAIATAPKVEVKSCGVLKVSRELADRAAAPYCDGLVAL
jgi:hypothetical protein